MDIGLFCKLIFLRGRRCEQHGEDYLKLFLSGRTAVFAGE
jgi:hypothetical protein